MNPHSVAANTLVSLAVAAVVAACTPTRDEATRNALLRARTQAELEAVLGVVGARVCREVTIGVGVPDMLRGTVAQVEGERLSVRIDDPGKHDHTIAGEIVRKGTVLTGPMKDWLPCK
ncbi:MAG TPA: hypothetical protein VED01_23545 [Burkholderiales bacterium]|nr:hypothetical protein [Burkholderiales bacterium]